MISRAVLVAGFAGPSPAGPCTVEIDRVQAQLDAKIDAEAGTGRSARESGRALRHEEPTPDSVLKAEESLGEGSASGAAMVALARARVADRAGDGRACEEALAKAVAPFSHEAIDDAWLVRNEKKCCTRTKSRRTHARRLEPPLSACALKASTAPGVGRREVRSGH